MFLRRVPLYALYREMPPIPVRLVGIACAVAVVSSGLLMFSRRAYPVPATNGVVLITGTGSGIGQHTALSLAEKGYTIFAGVRSHQNISSWERLLESLKRPNAVFPILLDVTSSREIDAAYDMVKAYCKGEKLPFSGLVNNAGVVSSRPLEKHPMQDIHNMFAVNTLGSVALTQRFMPLLRKDKGRVVFISSVAGKLVLPKQGAYAASKHALEAFADAFRQEVAPHDVSVSLIEPGFVATNMLATLAREELDANRSSAVQEHYAFLYKSSFLDAMVQAFLKAGDPDDVSKAILRALRDKYPATRYAVTNVSKLPAWAVIRLQWLLPDRLFDTIVTGS